MLRGAGVLRNHICDIYFPNRLAQWIQRECRDSCTDSHWLRRHRPGGLSAVLSAFVSLLSVYYIDMCDWCIGKIKEKLMKASQSLGEFLSAYMCLPWSVGNQVGRGFKLDTVANSPLAHVAVSGLLCVRWDIECRFVEVSQDSLSPSALPTVYSLIP